MNDRAFQIHLAKVYLRESASRRHQRGFSFTLLEWAGTARRQAAAIAQQQELFA